MGTTTLIITDPTPFDRGTSLPAVCGDGVWEGAEVCDPGVKPTELTLDLCAATCDAAAHMANGTTGAYSLTLTGRLLRTNLSVDGRTGNTLEPNDDLIGLGPSCGIRADGAAITLDVYGPELEGDFVDCAAASAKLCALDSAGEVACNHSSLEVTPPGPFVDVAVSHAGRACAVDSQGFPVCWGPNAYTIDPGTQPLDSLVGGSVHEFCGLTGGRVVCLGEPGQVLLGTDWVHVTTLGAWRCGQRADFSGECHDLDDNVVTLPDGIDMAASVGSVCVLTGSGTLACERLPQG